MNQKTLAGLTVAAVAAIVAAWFTSSRLDVAADESKTGAPLFPDLLAKVNDVTKVEVANKDGKFLLEKKGDEWCMSDKGGYPTNFDKVKELVVTIARANILEKKTAKAENYAALDVQDIGTKDAASTQVKLLDKDSKELAAVLIGKPHNTKGFGGEMAMYARKVGDAQAYEISGRVFVDGTATNWLDKQIAKLEKTRVHTVTTKQADGTTLEMHKSVPEEQVFTVSDVPQGEELKWNGVGDATAAALEWLNFEDVAPAGTVDLSGITPTETVFTTWDGVIVDAKLYEKGADKDAKSYLVLSASYDESKRFKKVEPVGPPAATDKKAETKTDAAKDGDAKPGDKKDDAAKPAEKKDEFVGKSPEEAKKEVDELNAKLSKWTYTIPGYSAANFKKTMKDLLKDKTPPPAAPATDDPNALTSPATPPESTPPAEPKKDGGG